jgi:hypothetical protein
MEDIFIESSLISPEHMIIPLKVSKRIISTACGSQDAICTVLLDE